METKSAIKSKTVWAALAIAVVSTLDGPIQEWVKTQTPLAGALVSIIMIVLRMVTSGKIKF